MLRWALTRFGVTDGSGLKTAKLLLNPITVRKIQAGGINSNFRGYSSETKDQLPSSQVFKHEGHNMYVCWHPEVPFPYEMTKPIDMNAPSTHSNMKIQALTPVREAFRKKHHKLVIQELIKLTYATKHRFYGRFGKSKRQVLREMDTNKQKRNREYL